MSLLRSFPLRKARPLNPRRLPEVYRTLHRAFGHQGWWPGRTPFEIMLGAILTQNTAWTNVEKAIRNLRAAGKLSPAALHRTPRWRLASLIRPSGYFNVKAARLKAFLRFFRREFGGRVSALRREPGRRLREKLLAVPGIGPETADSILLYAADKPFFVIDAYTKRVFSRHKLRPGGPDPEDYHSWQRLFEAHLPRRLPLYNDFHAQIVMLGKTYCKAARPLCEACPMNKYL